MSGQTAAVVLGAVAMALAAFAVWMAWRAHRALAVPPSRRMREVLGAVQAGEVERLPQLLRAIDHQLHLIEQRLGRLERMLPAAVQKIGLVRFDADPEMGGKVSFALALLDDHDDGVLITSVHRLEGTRVFLREVVGGKTEHELLPEEHRALNMAVDETLQARRRGGAAPGQVQAAETLAPQGNRNSADGGPAADERGDGAPGG